MLHSREWLRYFRNPAQSEVDRFSYSCISHNLGRLGGVNSPTWHQYAYRDTYTNRQEQQGVEPTPSTVGPHPPRSHHNQHQSWAHEHTRHTVRIHRNSEMGTVRTAGGGTAADAGALSASSYVNAQTAQPSYTRRRFGYEFFRAS